MNLKHGIIDWDNRLKLGIQVIDNQHEKLIELTNYLHYACLAGTKTANNIFIEAAHQAVKYVRYHFTTEEKLMILTGYPKYAFHKKEHDNFTKEVLTLAQKFNTNSHLIPNRFVHFLKDWVLSHIALCDKETVEYILTTNYQEKLDQLFSRAK